MSPFIGCILFKMIEVEIRYCNTTCPAKLMKLACINVFQMLSKFQISFHLGLVISIYKIKNYKNLNQRFIIDVVKEDISSTK